MQPSLAHPPAYTLLNSEAEYRQAWDSILGQAQREILIFDHDMAAPRPEEKARIEALTGFLQADSLRRIRMVLHDPGRVERDSPRLLRLVARFSHTFEVRQSPENLRQLADTHILGDEGHGVRRFHVDQPRCARIIDDPAYISPWRLRFEELWELSRPCLSVNPTGL